LAVVLLEAQNAPFLTQAVRTSIKSLFGCTAPSDKPSGAENKPECFNQPDICNSALRAGQERVQTKRFFPKMMIRTISKKCLTTGIVNCDLDTLMKRVENRSRFRRID